MQCLESLVQKVQPGVVINIEKIGPDPSPTNEIKDDNVGKENVDSSNRPDSENSLEDKSRVSSPMSISNGGSTATDWHNVRKLIYVQRSAQKGYSVGHWPLPESFWPDLNSAQLPP